MNSEATNLQLKTISVTQNEDIHAVKDKSSSCHDDKSKKSTIVKAKTCTFFSKAHPFEKGCVKVSSMGSEMYKVRWPKSFCNNHHKHCCTTGNDTCPHASSWLPSSNLHWNVCRQERNKISSRQQYLYECHSCQVCGWQEAWVHHKDATNVEHTTLKPWGSCRSTLHNPKNKEKFSVVFLVVDWQLTPLIGAKAAQQMGLITLNTLTFKMAEPPERLRTEAIRVYKQLMK